MVGRVVLEKVVTEADQQVTLDLTDIAQGTYILSIGDAKYKVVKKTKLIIVLITKADSINIRPEFPGNINIAGS